MADLEVMEYYNYELIGEKVIELAKMSPEARPKTVDELRAFLGPHISIPARLKKLEFYQGTDDTLVINLPARNELAQLEEQIKRETNSIHGYGIPDFYPLNPDPDTEFDPDRFSFFKSRVAEYSIRGCR
jgi:hypothetical protein